MQSGSSYDSSQNFALLLVGDYKSGKTGVAMAFPEPWFLDLDQNLSYWARRANAAKKRWYLDNPHFDAQKRELPKEAKWLRAGELVKAAARESSVQTIVIDGLAVLSEMLLDYLLSIAVNADGKRADALRIQDYGKFANILTGFITSLRTTGKYIIFTSHQVVEKDPITGRAYFYLNMPGRLSNTYGGFFSDVWAVTSNPNGGPLKYEIHTRPTGYHVNLGTSLEIPPTIDITNKQFDSVWSLLSPFIGKPLMAPTPSN